MSILDAINDQEQEAWKFLGQEIPELTDPAWTEPKGLLPPGQELNRALAIRTLRNCGPEKYAFLTSDQLFAMATQDLATCEIKEELDISPVGGVYIFLSLIPMKILKVGQTENLRYRVGRQHLRCGEGHTYSDLKAYFTSRRDDWPAVLRSEGVVAVILPLSHADKPERLAIEEGLRMMLYPEIDR